VTLFAETPPPRSKKFWAVSTAALVAASALDVRSSLGGYEINPLLRNAQGQFSTPRSIALKSGAIGGMLLAQLILTRKMPDSALYRPLGILNFSAAGVVSATALRNSRLRR
jgi:hypothetical protein